VQAYAKNSLTTSGISNRIGNGKIKPSPLGEGRNADRFVWVDDPKNPPQREDLEAEVVGYPGLTWTVVQVKDTVDPKSPYYNEKSRYAKTSRRMAFAG